MRKFVGEENCKSVCLFGGRYGVVRLFSVKDGTEKIRPPRRFFRFRRRRGESERRVVQDFIYECTVNDNPTPAIRPKTIGKSVGGIGIIDEKEGIWGSGDGMRGMIGGVFQLLSTCHVGKHLEVLGGAGSRTQGVVCRGWELNIIETSLQPRRAVLRFVL